MTTQTPASRLISNLQSDWKFWILLSAGAYNLLWGFLAIAFPTQSFELLQMDPPRYPQFWQCIGMIVGVYGIGYALAATDPNRHWPVVFVGFLGKIFGPIGFLGAIAQGTLPVRFGIHIVFNDIIWWYPFGRILWETYGGFANQEAPTFDLDRAFSRKAVLPLSAAQGQKRSLESLCESRPTLLVFLRHFGCTFCREQLTEIQKKMDDFSTRKIPVVLVHMSGAARGREFLTLYGLQGAYQISDPTKRFYRAFGLRRGTLGKLFGWPVWVRGWQAGVLKGHLVGALEGDGFQMPGAFLVYQRRIIHAFSPKHAGDHPDLADWLRTRLPPES